MAHQNPDEDEIRSLLIAAKTIAMVGASSKPDRPSYGIFRKLVGAGYRVIPVNPLEREVLGVQAYPSLLEVPDQVDIVDVFRRPEHTPEIAAQAVAIGARALWLQSGIVNEDAAARAREGGLVVVMDECIGVKHALLRIPKKEEA
ncbi:MAG TPA: CoA-binding protein [Polyangiaceae bacterium]